VNGVSGMVEVGAKSICLPPGVETTPAAHGEGKLMKDVKVRGVSSEARRVRCDGEGRVS
jgi:hypothetical protein